MWNKPWKFKCCKKRELYRTLGEDSANFWGCIFFCELVTVTLKLFFFFFPEVITVVLVSLAAFWVYKKCFSQEGWVSLLFFFYCQFLWLSKSNANIYLNFLSFICLFCFKCLMFICKLSSWWEAKVPNNILDFVFVSFIQISC